MSCSEDRSRHVNRDESAPAARRYMRTVPRCRGISSDLMQRLPVSLRRLVYCCTYYRCLLLLRSCDYYRTTAGLSTAATSAAKVVPSSMLIMLPLVLLIRIARCVRQPLLPLPRLPLLLPMQYCECCPKRCEKPCRHHCT
jgi:hypothetical protein